MRKHGAEVLDPAAHLGFALDHHDREPDVGKADRGAKSRDAGADNERLRHRLDDGRLERLQQTRAGDAGAHQSDRLVGGALMVVGVRPGALLAQVDLGVAVRVEAGALGDAAEGDGVELGRARGDHKPV